MKFFFILLILAILSSSLVSAAHWIVGYVEDALDGTSPNGRTARLWNPSNGDELFSIVGPSGPSSTSNVYLIDCEQLTNSCNIGDNLNITLTDDGSGHQAIGSVQVTVTGAGFDSAPNLSMNSPPSVFNVTVEDSFSSPPNEIDLSPATTTTVNCDGVVEDLDSAQSIINQTAQFYSTASDYGLLDDNNNHYTNNTCTIDTSYGTSTQAQINCTFQIQYYADADLWNCEINATDNSTANAKSPDNTTINTLLSIGVNDTLDYGTINANTLSSEHIIQVINYGNVPMNLSLVGYGTAKEDNLSMNCTTANISVEHTKYNLTAPNPGPMDLPTSQNFYSNLSSQTIYEELNLSQRKNDLSNEAINNTYWRIYVPTGVLGTCQGNIEMGATQS